MNSAPGTANRGPRTHTKVEDMVSYIEDYGVTFNSTCLECSVRLVTIDTPIRGTRDQVVPANATYTPGRPTLFCKTCIDFGAPEKIHLVDYEQAMGRGGDAG